MNITSCIDPLELLRLGSVPGIGSQRIRSLIRRFRTVSNVFGASVRELTEVEGIDKTLAHHIKSGGDGAFAERQMTLAKASGAALITFWDEEYPRLLRKIFDPPLLLYVRGKIETLQGPSVAVVGTRVPSAYGRLMAERFGGQLTEYEFVVVSGLARGVDTYAHRAAVQADGKTVAVLGSGVDVIYPDENKALSEQIVDHGALVSEFPMGTKPDAPHFPRRNRIIAGMSLATLVIEAGSKSGALITADLALDNGRDVFALPGGINNPTSIGCNRLIQQGAKLVMSIEDIVEELNGGRLRAKKTEPTVPLNEKEQRVFSVLTGEPQHIDKIAGLCQMSIADTLGVLLTLELKNIVTQTPGKHFMRQ